MSRGTVLLLEKTKWILKEVEPLARLAVQPLFLIPDFLTPKQSIEPSLRNFLTKDLDDLNDIYSTNIISIFYTKGVLS